MTGPALFRSTGLVAALSLLAACGTDGPPRAPDPATEAAAQPGISVSGEVQMGVVVVNPSFLER
jgi:predicted small lipoprotein YifL